MKIDKYAKQILTHFKFKKIQFKINEKQTGTQEMSLSKSKNTKNIPHKSFAKLTIKQLK